MPVTEVVFYQEGTGEAPVLDWLRDLRKRNRKAYANCVVAIERLGESGYELRRPTADTLRDGIYELRVRRGHVNYRILYFFHGRNVAILAHALTKKDKVPDAEIDRALKRKKLFEREPRAHSYYHEVGYGED
jgi:phage-related protein